MGQDKKQMAREEQIKQKAHELYGGNSLVCEQTFIDGARWADRHPQAQWVDVNDALPKDDLYVLVLNKIFGCCVAYRYNGKWWDNYNDLIYEDNSEITHWCNIPAWPNKSVESDD